MEAPFTTEALERVWAWAESDDRVDAVIVYGSVATGRADSFSDLDLLVVARDGAREELWAERQKIAEGILDGDVVFAQEVSWQRPYRYQAWRSDLAWLDLTVDEGRAEPWEGLAGGFEVLVDRANVGDRLRSDLEAWEPPEHDPRAMEGDTWVWLLWLGNRLRHGDRWRVWTNLVRILDERVRPLLAPEDASVPDQRDLEIAAPRSLEQGELWRSLRATTDLFDDALDRWEERTGRSRPEHPLVQQIRKRLGVEPGARRAEDAPSTFPVVVAAFVFDDEGRVLLMRENYGQRRYGPPGGRVEADETPQQAVVREVREETGLDVIVEHLVGMRSFTGWTGESGLGLFFRCRVLSGEPRMRDPGEIAELGWFDPEDHPSPFTNAEPLLPHAARGDRGVVVD